MLVWAAWVVRRKARDDCPVQQKDSERGPPSGSGRAPRIAGRFLPQPFRRQWTTVTTLLVPVMYPGAVCEVGITTRSRERPWCKRTRKLAAEFAPSVTRFSVETRGREPIDGLLEH